MILAVQDTFDEEIHATIVCQLSNSTIDTLSYDEWSLKRYIESPGSLIRSEYILLLMLLQVGE